MGWSYTFLEKSATCNVTRLPVACLSRKVQLLLRAHFLRKVQLKMDQSYTFLEKSGTRIETWFLLACFLRKVQFVRKTFSSCTIILQKRHSFLNHMLIAYIFRKCNSYHGVAHVLIKHNLHQTQ